MREESESASRADADDCTGRAPSVSTHDPITLASVSNCGSADAIVGGVSLLL